jgi:hypothetical protein
MVSAVISSFVICWTPMQIYLLYTHHNQVAVFLTIVSQSLVYISSCVNPILYAFLSEPFRKAFKQFLTCSKFLSNSNGNDLTTNNKKSTYRAIQRQQAMKSVPLKPNINNNNHRMKTETNSTTITSEPIKYDRLSNTNLTNIN